MTDEALQEAIERACAMIRATSEVEKVHWTMAEHLAGLLAAQRERALRAETVWREIGVEPTMESCDG